MSFVEFCRGIVGFVEICWDLAKFVEWIILREGEICRNLFQSVVKSWRNLSKEGEICRRLTIKID